MSRVPTSDELAGGSPRDPVRLPRAVKAVGLCAAVVLAGWLAVRGERPAAEDTNGEAAPTVSAPAAATTPPVSFPSQPGSLGIDAVCARLDQRRLSVAVDLTNGGLTRLTLLSASPVLPLGGLRPLAEVLPAKRTCEGRPPSRAGLVMRPGGVVPLRLHLQLPASGCQDGHVVQVAVTYLGAGERPVTQRLTLLRALSDVDLAACPEA